MRRRRGSLPGLPYCCSVGLTLATVVGEPHCCSVVTVNTSNTVQFPTLNSSTVMLCACMQYGWQMRGTRERARVACMSMCECVDFCHLTLESLYD